MSVEHDLGQVQRITEAENVAILVVRLGSLFRAAYGAYIDNCARMSLMQAQAFLQVLGSKTSGFAWFPAQLSAVTDVIEGLMQSIATQYG